MLGLLLLAATFVVQRLAHRPLKMWAAGALLGTAIGVLLVVTGLVGISGLLTVAGAGALLTSVVSWMTPTTTPKLAFEATHRHDHIAIDATGRVWARDISGEEVILTKDDVQQWTHHYVANGKYRARNRIELRTRDLNRPLINVRFDRHPDTVWGAPHNASEAAEWHARLSALLHH